MAEATTIGAAVRERAGKGAARATRRAGQVPGVIYGKKFSPILISLEPSAVMQEMRKHGFFSRIFEIDLGGEKHRVLARDVQFDPVTDRLTHVDFMRFTADTKLNVEVEVVFENEDKSPGIKRGGVLNIVRHTIEMVCSAENIPPYVTVDLTGLDIGDGVHISNVPIPEGARPTITDRDFTIATIAAPTIMKTEEEEAAEAAAAAAAAVEGAAEGEPGAVKPAKEGEGEPSED